MFSLRDVTGKYLHSPTISLAGEPILVQTPMNDIRSRDITRKQRHR